MKEWKKYKALELCTDIIDCVNKTAPISSTPTDFHMLRTSDIRNGFVNLENLNCVTEETFLKWSRRGFLKEGDVIFTREAPLGEVGLVRYAKNYFLGQRLVLYRTNPEICDNRFLLYWFLNPQNKESIKSKGVGSTVTHLRVPECEKIEIYAPDLAMQKRIGGILSAYDDLIENNQNQIKLLEEAAQRLYKEWFVDLRFPDYENTPVVDGVPEGWRIGRLDELGEFKRGKTITKDSVIVGNVPVVAGGLEPAYYHNTANTTAPVITISGSGNAGYVRMYYQKIWASDCSYIDTSKTDYIFFTYCFLKYNQNILYNLKKGSTILHVYAKDINAMKCLIPNEKIAIRFNKFVCPMFFKIGKLYKQIEELKEARDRLLPKLISGELEV